MNMHALIRPVAVMVAVTASLVLANEANAQRLSDTTIVRAFGVNTYTQTFEAGRTITINLVGDGDTDLDIFVHDMYGNLIVADTNLTDICSVRFEVYRTSPFTIRVVNHGSVYNRYRIWVE